MRTRLRLIANIVCFSIVLANCFASEPASQAPLPAKFQKLVPLHTKLGPPQPGDWLEKHPEPGQTYWQYVHSGPRRAGRQRRVIYVQPLGEFDKTQRRVTDLTAEFLRAYFQLPVRVREDLSLDDRFKGLAAFSQAQGLKREQEFYEQSLAVLKQAK